MIKPVPQEPGSVRDITFVCKEYPPAYIQGRLMKTMDFLQELDERLPLKANVIVTKHASPGEGDYETLLAIRPDPNLYRLFNDGINQPTWSIAGQVQYRH